MHDLHCRTTTNKGLHRVRIMGATIKAPVLYEKILQPLKLSSFYKNPFLGPKTFPVIGAISTSSPITTVLGSFEMADFEGNRHHMSFNSPALKFESDPFV
jgi:hypothetical protein